MQQGEVGKEVLLPVDRAVDLLELRQLLGGAPPPLLHERAERVDVVVVAEEQLEQQAVAPDAGRILAGVEPAAQCASAVGGERVDLLVRPLLLDDGRNAREPAGDEPGEKILLFAGRQKYPMLRSASLSSSYPDRSPNVSRPRTAYSVSDKPVIVPRVLVPSGRNKAKEFAPPADPSNEG
jgi:hypothetical protein